MRGMAPRRAGMRGLPASSSWTLCPRPGWAGGDPEVAAAPPAPAETAVRVRVVAPAPVASEAVHADVYFDFKSVRLKAEAVRVLQHQAALMDRESTWGVLVQGYADRQGP